MIKRHHQIWAGFFLIVINWLPGGSLWAQNAVPESKKLQQIKGEISQLESKIEQDRRSRKLIIEELARTEKEIGRLGRYIHRLQGSIEQLDLELNELAKQKNQQQSELDKQKDQLRSLVLSAYATGRQERIKLFLNQQDPVLMNRILTYYDYFNRQRIQQIKIANELLGQIHRTEQLIQDKKVALDDSYREKQHQLDTMHEAKQARSTLVAKLDSEIKDKSTALGQLQADAEALQKLLADIERQQALKKLQSSQKFSSMKGKLPWPVSGYLSKTFGQPKVGEVSWDGVFITAPEGREVKAVHQGRVVYSDWLRGYGLLMIIDHGDGYLSLYGHNQSLFREVGDMIEAGEPIAVIGNSGGQKNHGLYFSIRQQGKPTNPTKWCQKSRGRKI